MIKKEVDPQYLSLYPYYGRHGQDKYLHEKIFGDLKKGRFLDIGAYDGIESSNTLFFEETLGWTGICVEPLPHIFQKLVKNRKGPCINKCALDSNKTGHFQHVLPFPKKKEVFSERTPNIEKRLLV